jgi:hypothetical protein
VEAFEGGVGDEAGFGGHDLLLTTPRILPQHTQLHSTFLPLLINLHLPKVNRLILPPLQRINPPLPLHLNIIFPRICYLFLTCPVDY